MKPIILVMLAVQAAVLIVTVWTMLSKRQAPNPRQLWSGLAISQIIISGTSIRIASSHAGQPGADLLATGAPLILGMALMTVLILLRERKERA